MTKTSAKFIRSRTTGFRAQDVLGRIASCGGEGGKSTQRRVLGKVDRPVAQVFDQINDIPGGLEQWHVWVKATQNKAADAGGKRAGAILPTEWVHCWLCLLAAFDG